MIVVKCIVFFVVVFNFISAQEDVETGDNLQYQFFPVVGTSLQFQVRARNDAHIALSMHPQESDPMYEVVIGGWGNTKSVIRRTVCSRPDKDEKQMPSYLSENEFRGFWVHWDKGILSAGREGEDNPFLSWRDPEPLPIRFVGVHTGYGSKGVWKLESTNNSAEAIDNRSSAAALEKYEVKTDQHDITYQFFPVSGNALRFKVRAKNDAIIALTMHPWASGPMYQIVIGGWSNSRSVIRRRFCDQPEEDSVPTPQFLNNDEFRRFWMRWDNGMVLVGRSGETSPFLSWHDPEPFKVAFVGVRTGFGSNGIWKIEKTGDNLQYEFFPVVGTSLQFQVRVRNDDAHIALSMHPQESDPMYEVVIGAWGNTKSVIRRTVCSRPDRDEKQTPSYLSENEFRGFWVHWDKGILSAGREGEDNPFLSWKDPEPLRIRFVGVHTGYGSKGVWKIESTNNSAEAIDTRSSAAALEKYEVKTDQHDITYQFFPVSGNALRFKVRAKNDAIIALTMHPWASGPMYQIVIGGWSNSRSVIRRRFCDQLEMNSVPTPQFLNNDEFRGFWMRWDNGIVLVGRSGETSPFLSWHDPEPFKVAFVGIRTGFGSTSIWKIEKTGDNLQYEFFPVVGTSLQFQVRVRNDDAHIALSMHPLESDPMYEVVIGAWGNTKSVIRRTVCSRPDRDEKQTPSYLSENEFRGFWVHWDKGILSAGREGEDNPFLSWKDPEPLRIRFVGVHTGYGSKGVWKIESTNNSAEAIDTRSSAAALEKYEVKTDQHDITYQFFPVSGNALRFKVRAKNDAVIALTMHPWASGPMYQIVIGGWSNSRSVIRRRFCDQPEKNSVPTPQFLNNDEFSGFWMRWDNGIVLVGRSGETSPFLSWHDPEPFKVAFVGIRTGFGSTSIWKIENVPSDPSNINNEPVVVPLVLPAPTPVPTACGTTLTRLRQGTACAGQTIFEENFDALREEVWTVQQYVPNDHPELPFVSYQRLTVSVKNGHLHITPVLQQDQPGFTYYSLYSTLDLYNGCTSGQSSSCSVEASDGASIIPPIVTGRISSRSSFIFTYGTISVRAKLPQGDWIYPEILLEPLVKKFVYGSKNSGMVKIACTRGNLDLIKGSTQYGNKVLYSGPVIDTKCHQSLLISKQSAQNWGDDFHVYSVKWTPENLILSVDGEEYGRVEPTGGLRALLPNTCDGPAQPGMAPFNDHFYITLGLAVGGHSEFPDASMSKDHKKPWKNHASKATLNFWNDIDAWHDTWEFPNLLIDYVKVVAL